MFSAPSYLTEDCQAYSIDLAIWYNELWCHKACLSVELKRFGGNARFPIVSIQPKTISFSWSRFKRCKNHLLVIGLVDSTPINRNALAVAVLWTYIAAIISSYFKRLLEIESVLSVPYTVHFGLAMCVIIDRPATIQTGPCPLFLFLGNLPPSSNIAIDPCRIPYNSWLNCCCQSSSGE